MMAVYHGAIKYASVEDAVKALGPVVVTHQDGKAYVRPLNSEPSKPRHVKRY
jgi:hypothetical protein